MLAGSHRHPSFAANQTAAGTPWSELPATPPLHDDDRGHADHERADRVCEVEIEARGTVALEHVDDAETDEDQRGADEELEHEVTHRLASVADDVALRDQAAGAGRRDD